MKTEKVEVSYCSKPNIEKKMPEQFSLGRDTGKAVSELHRQLIELHKQLRDKLKKKWNRSLPLGDELLDRFERAKYLGFGEGTSIYDSSLVIGNVKVGENTWIGPFTVLDGSGGLTIGSFCSISSGVQIISHDSVKWALSGGNAEYEYAPVEIGDCCYIGGMSLINKGVKIGKCCLIGANSLVNKDIPAYSIAFGTPVKIVGEVKEKKTGEIELIYYEGFRNNEFDKGRYWESKNLNFTKADK